MILRLILKPLCLFILFAVPGLIHPVYSQPPEQKKEAPVENAKGTTPGQFFVLDEPVTEESVRALETAVQNYIRKELEKGAAPVVVFEFRSRSSADQPASRFGAILELCQFLSKRLVGARTVVGFVPEPLTGYMSLAPLACQEIVMQAGATIGPVVPKNADVLTTKTVRSFVSELAASLGRSPDLYEGLVDEKLDVNIVTTNDNQKHFVLGDRLAEFSRTHAIVHQQKAWENGTRRKIDEELARGVISRLTVNDKSEILPVYRLAQDALRTDPTLTQRKAALWIKIEGRLDHFKAGYIKRKLGLIDTTSSDIVIFEFDVRGNDLLDAKNLAHEIEKLSGVSTIGYVTGKAEGYAVLPLLACDMILVRESAKIGDVYLVNLDNNERRVEKPDRQVIEELTRQAVVTGQTHGHSSGIIKGLFDASSTVIEALDLKSGGLVFIEATDAEAEKNRYQKRRVVKEPDTEWSLDSTNAIAFGFATLESSPKTLTARLGLEESRVTIVGPSWVDVLVSVLNNRFMTGLILTTGLFLLILEFKLPGIGLPAIGATVCFMLFFWSHYLSGTADQLEILLFAIGLIFMALELFVFPGFGIFGLAGVVLAVLSIVLASHTFIWPRDSSQYREMSGTLLQLLLAMLFGVFGIVWLSKNLKKMPMFRHLVLSSAEGIALGSEAEKLIMGDSDLNLSHLIGQSGLTTTTLRPTGKARFGDQIVDATAEVGMIDANQPIEVIGTRGLRLIVRRAEQTQQSQAQPPNPPPSRFDQDPFRFDEDLFQP